MLLSVLSALAGGVALATAAGARRTASAYPRFLRSAESSQVTVDLPADLGGHTPAQIADALPGVAGHSLSSGMLAFLAGPDGAPDFEGAIQAVASVDGRFFTTDRLALVAGRFPVLDRPDEAVVNETLAKRRHIAPGDHLTILRETVAEAGPAASGGLAAVPTPVLLRVTGVVVGGDEVVQDDVSRTAVVTLTSAYYAQHTADTTFLRLGLRLRKGRSGVAGVQAAAQRLLDNPDDPAGNAHVEDAGEITARAQHAIRPTVVVLALFAGLALAVALLVIGQALSRHIRRGAVEHPVLRALGLEPRQLFVLSTLTGAVVAVLGGAGAVATAFVLSPLFPLVPVRQVEPRPGLSLDATVLVGGGLIFVVLVLCRAGLAARRVSRLPAERRTAGTGAGNGVVAGLPPSVGVGVRFALEPGRGGTAVPVRATLAGAIVALAAVGASLTFGANLAHLRRTPALYGWNWDLGYLSSGGYGSYTADDLHPLDGDPAVAAYSTIAFDDVLVDGVATSALGLAQVEGSVLPPVIAGRPLSSDQEILLGTSTLRRIHKSIGDWVTVTLAKATGRYRVVGRAVLPSFGRVDARRAGLGDGVVMSAPALARMAPGDQANAVVVRLAAQRLTPGSSQEGARSRLREELGDPRRDEEAYGAQRAADLANGARPSSALLLVGLLGLAAAATLGHTLVSSIRERRRDLALLKTLGFVRRQVGTAVASFATALVLAALVVAIPLGLASGRWSYRLFAVQLGAVADPVLPLLATLATVPIALAVANLVAAGPAWVAGRTSAAHEFRGE